MELLYLNPFLLFMLGGFATSVTAMTISSTWLFKPIRDFLKKHLEELSLEKESTFESSVVEFLLKLISCPYCLSHWVALFLVIAIPDLMLLKSRWHFFDPAFNALALTGVASFGSHLIDKTYYQ